MPHIIGGRSLEDVLQIVDNAHRPLKAQIEGYELITIVVHRASGEATMSVTEGLSDEKVRDVIVNLAHHQARPGLVTRAH